jgi:hypothetical protein
MNGGFYFADWASFRSYFGAVLRQNLESLSFCAYHVIECIDLDRINCSARVLAWNTFSKLRSLELHRLDPAGFHDLAFPQLRKLVLSHLSAVVCRRLAGVVMAAGEELESLSISTRFGEEPQGPNIENSSYEVYDSHMVCELLRRMKLRRFSSIGNYFFYRKDWEALCARAFPDYRFVHVEQPLVDESELENNDGLEIYMNSKNEIQPLGLLSIHGGRAFVPMDESHRWSLIDDCDGSSTLLLFGRFLADADPECDLVISRGMIVKRYTMSNKDGGVRAHRPFCDTDLSKSPEQRER